MVSAQGNGRIAVGRDMEGYFNKDEGSDEVGYSRGRGPDRRGGGPKKPGLFFVLKTKKLSS